MKPSIEGASQSTYGEGALYTHTYIHILVFFPTDMGMLCYRGFVKPLYRRMFANIYREGVLCTHAYTHMHISAFLPTDTGDALLSRLHYAGSESPSIDGVLLWRLCKAPL